MVAEYKTSMLYQCGLIDSIGKGSNYFGCKLTRHCPFLTILAEMLIKNLEIAYYLLKLQLKMSAVLVVRQIVDLCSMKNDFICVRL